MENQIEKCENEHDSSLNVFIGVFLVFGILFSYLPQHYKIIKTKTSEGISSWFLLLGAISMTCSWFNILILQFAQFGCCIHKYYVGICFEKLLATIQLTIQWFSFVLILILFMIYFPEYKKYISNVSLGNGYNSLISTIYTPEWLLALRVARTVAGHFVVTLIISVCLLIFVGGAEEKATRIWADLLGLISSALASVQYLPQIWKTWKRKSVGALSIQMMMLQTPGAFLFAYSLAQSDDARWSTWFVFVITGCLQGTLLIMCICWHYREKRLKRFDDELVVSSDGNIIPDEHTRLLGQRNS